MAVAPSPLQCFSSTALTAICTYAQVCRTSREEVELRGEKLWLTDPKCSAWQHESGALRLNVSLSLPEHAEYGSFLGLETY